MKVKVSEAEGQVLDWMVAKCEGCPVHAPDWNNRFIDAYGYSREWDKGGPIIERERITLAYGEDEKDWFACVGDSRRFDNDTPDGLEKIVSPTPLIAAMRCYVASKLGDEVDVPEVLA